MSTFTDEFPLLPWSTINQLNTGQVAKADKGTIGWYYFFNAGASVNYLKIYDKATTPDQDDTPVLTLPLPAGQGANCPTPFYGIKFSNGISFRATTGVAPTNNTPPGANEVIVNIGYK